MGPSEEAMRLANFLINECGLTVDRYALGYAIDGWCDAEEARDAKKEQTP